MKNHKERMLQGLLLLKRMLLPVIEKMLKLLTSWISYREGTVMFISYHGKGYSDNPRALYEFIIKDRRFDNWKFIWVAPSDNLHMYDERTIVVKYGSVRYMYYLARAKFWVINCKMPEYIDKKKGQVYLQTWHGTPLKRLAHDLDVLNKNNYYRSNLSYEEMTRSYDIDVEKYDYMISPNSFTTEVFQTAFGIDKDRLIETGYPRNDILSNATKEQIQKIKVKYKIPQDKKVLLYAPTWRDNSYIASGYTFELLVDFYKWREKLGEEYVVVFKPHYLISNEFDLKELEGFIYMVPSTTDISELYLITDVLITDYSSVFFDFAILNKPIYFYMYDLDEYKDELRGFYIDIYKDIPGDVFQEEETMLEEIRGNVFDYNRLEQFNRRFNNMEDGNATKRVIDIVFNQM